MTKKETAEMDALRDQLRLTRALRFTAEVKPDLPPPAHAYASDALTKGFLFLAYSGIGGDRINPACSSSVHHNPRADDKTTTQQPCALYSTRLLALRGLRHEAEQEAAKRLAAIDKQIEEELIKE